jgi:hypothetical protein
MDPGFSSSLNALIDAGNASGHPLTIESGDRDTATQTSLWNAAVAKYGPDEAPNWVAPGHSYHEKGLADDLSGDLDWAQAHAADFDLYFPLANERWHIEPVGSRGDNSTPGSYVTGTTGPTVAGSITKTPKSTDAFNVILDMLGVGKGSLGGAAGSTITVNPRSQQPQSAALLDSGPPPTISSANGFQSQLDRFMALTREHESSGNYRAVGPSTPWGNATGAYQFLDGTWNYYGGYARAADAPPEVQDARARDLMTQYYNQFGDWGSVAGAWFAGPGGDFSTDEVQGYINWMNARL